MRFLPPPRSAALAALLALGACQAATVPMREDDIPAGRALVPGGLTADGASVVALGAAADACGAPEVWGRSTSGWREVATGAPVPVSPCPSLTARLSPDGRVLAVHDFGAGRAMVYDLTASGLVPAGTATIEGTAGSRFPPPGPNVALSADGGRLLLGSLNRGCRHPAGGERICGTAVLFARDGERWRSIATLRPPEAEDGFTRFGQSVALTGDGTLALAGGTGVPGGVGALWVYRLDGGEPRPLQRLTAPDEQPEFANSLSLAADGSWLAVGGSQAVHLFRRQGDGFVLDRVARAARPARRLLRRDGSALGRRQVAAGRRPAHRLRGGRPLRRRLSLRPVAVLGARPHHPPRHQHGRRQFRPPPRDQPRRPVSRGPGGRDPRVHGGRLGSEGRAAASALARLA